MCPENRDSFEDQFKAYAVLSEKSVRMPFLTLTAVLQMKKNTSKSSI